MCHDIQLVVEVLWRHLAWFGRRQPESGRGNRMGLATAHPLRIALVLIMSIAQCARRRENRTRSQSWSKHLLGLGQIHVYLSSFCRCDSNICRPLRYRVLRLSYLT
ncbi:hypothetical protein BDR03DRAFT_1088310 [Suillus americanus]|nr:hypothetical protein BDR03DRAFT_1088310 [Suillus americanus]